SELFRLQRERDGLQLDFMGRIDGAKSYESLRAGAQAFDFGGHELLVSALEDVVRSKRAAGRDRDRAVLDILKETLDERQTEKAAKIRSRKGKRPRST